MTWERVRDDLLTRKPRRVTGPLLPPFPAAVLPGWASEMVLAVAESMQTPVDLPGMTCLGALSACAAGRVEVEIRRGWRETTALYVAVVAESSERKSPVHRLITAPLRAAEAVLAEAAGADRAQAAMMRDIAVREADAAREAALAMKDKAKRPEALAEALVLQASADALQVPPPPRLLAGGDATPEAIVQLLVRYQRMAIMDTEGGLFDLLAGRHSNGRANLDAVLQAYSGDPIAVERRGRDPEYVARPALALALAVQPLTLQRLVRDPDMTGRGLVARFLLAVPRPMVGRRRTGADVRPVPFEVEEQYGARLQELAVKLHGWGNDPVTISLTPPAREVLYDFEAAVERRLGLDGDLRVTGAWGGKLVGQAVRLAGLLHLATHGPDRGPKRGIDPSAVRAAVEVAEYAAAHAIAGFRAPDAGGEVSEVAEVLAKIRSAELRPQFARRDLHRKLRSARFAGVAAVTAALEVLEEHGWVARADPLGLSWVPHPAIWGAER